MASQYIKNTYFDSFFCLDLNTRGYARLADIKYNASHDNTTKKELSVKIQRVFGLNKGQLKTFKYLYNIK